MSRFDHDLDKCARALGIGKSYLQKRLRELA